MNLAHLAPAPALRERALELRAGLLIHAPHLVGLLMERQQVMVDDSAV